MCKFFTSLDIIISNFSRDCPFKINTEDYLEVAPEERLVQERHEGPHLGAALPRTEPREEAHHTLHHAPLPATRANDLGNLMHSRPEFKSRLGTPEEALYRAEAMRITTVVPYSRVVYINILCLLD